LRGYNNVIWTILKQGHIQKALQFSKITDKKIEAKIINEYKEDELKLFKDFQIIIQALNSNTQFK